MPARVTAACVCVRALKCVCASLCVCVCACTSILKRVFNSLLYRTCRPGNWHPIDAAQGGLFSFPGAHQSNRGRCRCSPDLLVCLSEWACVGVFCVHMCICAFFFFQLCALQLKSNKNINQRYLEFNLFSIYSVLVGSYRRRSLDSVLCWVSLWGQSMKRPVIQFYLDGNCIPVSWTWSWLDLGFLMVNGS